MLIAFDTQKIDQVIRQLETEIRLTEANIKLAELEQPHLERSLPMDLDKAERTKREADEDLDYFLLTGRPEAEKRADQNLRLSALSLDYAKEQLRQLEKMYKLNDLTEETEQIILKRQRAQVENETFNYKAAQTSHELVMKTALPRREKGLRDEAAKQALSLEKLRNTMTPTLTQKQLNLAKMRFDRDKNKTGLEIMLKDREAMTILAPADGVVYYGKFSKGQWEAAATLVDKLVPDGTVMPNEVFMTIVKPGRLLVRLQIEEKDIQLIKMGLTGKVKLVFNPDQKLSAKVTKVSAVPTVPGKFEVHAVLDVGAAAGVLPGMACSVKFVPYSRKQAVVVPSAAVIEEDDGHVVNVVGKNGKTERRQVTAGRSSDGHTEILDGLSEGEEIFLERPDANRPAAPPGGKDK